MHDLARGSTMMPLGFKGSGRRVYAILPDEVLGARKGLGV